MSGANLFIGLDLVDGCRQPVRNVDVAIMDGSRLCIFEQWDLSMDGNGLLPNQLAPPGYILAIDGPQGLAASRDRRMRECERAGGVAGKSPYKLVNVSAPFAGFVSTSVRLFAALWQSGRFHLHGLPRSEAHEAILIEVCPGRGWTVLANKTGIHGRLHKKTLVKGREQRRDLLKSIGVTMPGHDLASHDQLDAALAAETAIRFAEGRSAEQGEPPFWDASNGVLREGFIVYP